MSSSVFSRYGQLPLHPSTPNRMPLEPAISARDGVDAKARCGASLSVEGKAVFFRINHLLDRVGVPHGLNERFLENLLMLAESVGQHQFLVYWLTLARLMEATLLCAGHYADNCEFSAAGDLLVNPRKIRVQLKDGTPAFEKARHSRLSDQLAKLFPGRGDATVDKRDATCEIVAPALLPYLFSQLVVSGYFSWEYIDHVETRLTAIADTIGFLAAGQIFSNEALHRRLQSVDQEQKEFIETHLCRFDDTWYLLFGSRIHQIRSGYKSMDEGGAVSLVEGRDRMSVLAENN